MSCVRKLLVVTCVLALAACSSSAKKSVAPGRAPSYTPRLEARHCAYDPPLAVKTDCWWLVVPEDRAKPGGRDVKLAVAVLHSTAKTPRADPVVYLHGGPGG